MAGEIRNPQASQPASFNKDHTMSKFSGDPIYTILGCGLWCTCSSHPEQYEVDLGDVMIGYLRLRNGRFTADYTDVGGDRVYTAEPEGFGRFTEAEREGFLTAATEKLLERHKETTSEEDDE